MSHRPYDVVHLAFWFLKINASHEQHYELNLRVKEAVNAALHTNRCDPRIGPEGEIRYCPGS